MKFSWFCSDDVSLRYYYTENAFPPILLLHEMGLCLEAWDEVAERLSSRYSVLRLDIRGLGLSQRLSAPPVFDELVMDIKNLLEHCDLNQPITIVGGALGGAIALGFASSYPELTKSIVAASPAVGVDPTARDRSVEGANTIRKHGYMNVMNSMIDTVYPHEVRTAQRFEKFKHLSSAVDSESCSHLYRMIADFSLDDRWSKIKAPCHLIGGKFDFVRPSDVVKQLAGKIDRAQFHEIATGHYISLQAPELLCNIVEQFA